MYGELAPIHIAIIKKSIPLLQLLLDSGADVNKATDAGSLDELSLHLRLSYSDAERRGLINDFEVKNYTPLMLSLKLLKSDPNKAQLRRIIKLLIARGADLSNFSVMRSAILSGDLAVVKLLYASGAASTQKDDVNLVEYAAEHCQSEMVEFFLKKGLKPHLGFDFDNSSCDLDNREQLADLEAKLQQCQMEMIYFLLKNNVRLNPGSTFFGDFYKPSCDLEGLETKLIKHRQHAKQN